MATYALTIGGVAKSMLHSSLRISETANGRNTASFSVLSRDGSYRPAIGAEVILTEDGTRIFGGYVDKPSESGSGDIGLTPIITRVTAVDYNSVADRRYVSLNIGAGTLLAALQAIDAGGYLTAYGMTFDATTTAPGPSLPALLYTYRQLTEVFNELAALSGYVWEIDYNKNWRMKAPSSTAAPFNLAAGDGNVKGDITVEPTRQDYANRVIVRYSGRGGAAYAFLRAVGANFNNNEEVAVAGRTYTFKTVLTGAENEVLIGSSTDDSLQNVVYAIEAYGGLGGVKYGAGTIANSEVTAFMLRTGMMQVLARAVGAGGNSIACTETCANAEWVTEGNVGTATLTFGYDPGLGYTAEANDVTEQGANGLWERVIDAEDVFDYTVALALAESYLSILKSSPTAKSATYVTERTGIRPGMTQTITLPTRNLSGTFTVTDVSSYIYNKNILRRQVTVQAGTAIGKRWTDDAKRVFSGGGSSTSATIINGGGGSGGGGVGGSGTAGKIPKWSDAANLTDSIMTESGSTISVSGTLSATTLSGSLNGANVVSNSLALSKLEQISTGTVLGRSAVGTGDIAAIGTLPNGVQDNITRLGTVTSGVWNAGAGTFAGHVVPSATDTYDIGSNTAWWRNAFISQMSAVVFVKETQQLYGGWLSVSKNVGVFAAAVAVGATTINFGQSMTANQFVVVRGPDTGGTIRVEYIKVVSLSSGTTYNVERDKANVNPTNQGWAWAMGTPYMVRGIAGDGWIELQAYDTPRMSVFTQGSAYNNSAETIRIGHLTGMPNSSSGIGSYMGDSARYIRWDGTELKLVTDTTTIDANGIALGGGAGAYSLSAAYKFTRPAAGTYGDFGQTGDKYGVDAFAIVGEHSLNINNIMMGLAVGAGGDDGKSSITMSAKGWDSAGSGANTWQSALTLSSYKSGIHGAFLSGKRVVISVASSPTSGTESVLTLEGPTSMIGEAYAQYTSSGRWTSKSVATTYQADCDGIVILQIDATANTGAGDGIIYTDSASPPTVVHARSTTPSGDRGTLTSPVKKGDYWAANATGTGVTCSVYWYGLGTSSTGG